MTYESIHVDVYDRLSQVSSRFDLEELSSAIVLTVHAPVDQPRSAVSEYLQSSEARLSAISWILPS